MTLDKFLSMIVDCDDIDIQDMEGSFYSGLRKDFNMPETLTYTVDCVRAYKNILIILCSH